MSIYNTISRVFPTFDNELQGLDKYLHIGDRQYDYFVLGSMTACHAFDFSDLGINGFNGAIESQTVSYDYRLLCEYKKNIKMGGTVIWMPCVFSLCVAEYDRVWHRRYYCALNKDNLYHYSKLEALKSILVPMLKAVKHSLKPTCSKDSKMEIAKHAQLRWNCWCKQFGMHDDFSESDAEIRLQKEIEYAVGYLKKLIALCEKTELRFCIVIPPLSRELTDRVGADIVDRFLLKYLHPLNEAYGFPLYNYFNSDKFTDDSLFMNSDCLNNKGQIAFTEDVISRIEEYDGKVGRKG